MKILVLGGSRFLGLAIAKELIRSGHELSVLNRGNSRPNSNMNAEHLEADRKDPTSLRRVLLGRHFDIVVDNSGYERSDIELLFSVPQFTFNRYLFTSTAWLLRPDKNDLDRETQRYIKGKGDSEDFLRGYSPAPYRIIRPALILGAGDHTLRSFYYLFRIASQKPYFVAESGTWSFPYVYVGDVARLVCHLINETVWNGEVFHAVSDHRLSPAQMISFWCSEYSFKDYTVSKPSEWLQKEMCQYFDEEPFFNESRENYPRLQPDNKNRFQFTDQEMLLKKIADDYFDRQDLVASSLNGGFWMREAELASQAVHA